MASAAPVVVMTCVFFSTATVHAAVSWLDAHAPSRPMAVTKAVVVDDAGQPPSPDAQNFTFDDSIARALGARLTMRRTAKAGAIFIEHCRKANEGCVPRILSFAKSIRAAAHAHSVDPFLLAAIAVHETGLDPFVRGTRGERGIVQLHPRWAGRASRFVRSAEYRRACVGRAGVCQEEVVDLGASYLASCVKRCKSLRSGISAYNRGSCGFTPYASRVLKERRRLMMLSRDARHARALERSAELARAPRALASLDAF